MPTRDSRSGSYVCPECGFGYVRGIRSNSRQHHVFHDETLQGVPVGALRSGKVVWSSPEASVLVVTPRSPKLERIQARKLARLANREMHYDFGIYSEHEPTDERDLHLFLCAITDRLVGLMTFERRGHIWRANWPDYDRGERDPPRVESEPIWSLGFAWVHSAHRGLGIAHSMFDKAVQYLQVDKASVGLYTPFTVDGERLARSLFPVEFLVAR